MSDKTNLCLAIREQQNDGCLPDGSTRLHRGDERLRHFMDTSSFAEATVMPEIALAKVDPDAALDVSCALACGATTGTARRSISPNRARLRLRRLGAGLVGLGAGAGRRLAGAERIIAVDLSQERLEHAKRQGAVAASPAPPSAARDGTAP